jgi:hypothetical protein
MDNEDLYDEFGNYIGPDPDDDQDDDEVRACVRACVVSGCPAKRALGRWFSPGCPCAGHAPRTDAGLWGWRDCTERGCLAKRRP